MRYTHINDHDAPKTNADGYARVVIGYNKDVNTLYYVYANKKQVYVSHKQGDAISFAKGWNTQKDESDHFYKEILAKQDAINLEYQDIQRMQSR